MKFASVSTCLVGACAALAPQLMLSCAKPAAEQVPANSVTTTTPVLAETPAPVPAERVPAAPKADSEKTVVDVAAGSPDHTTLVAAVKAADLLVIFHVPLFTRWLKEVMDAGTRVLMIIDGPDDLEQLMSPPGLKEAVKYAEARYARTREVRVVSDAGTDLHYSRGEYPVMAQWGFADEPGHFDHWGGGHLHTFPNEGSANGTVVIQPGDIVILPYCRYVQDAVRLEIRDGFVTRIEGGLDAKLMRDWLEDGKASDDDRDPYAVSHLGWGLNPQARWYSLALNGDEPERQPLVGDRRRADPRVHGARGHRRDHRQRDEPRRGRGPRWPRGFP